MTTPNELPLIAYNRAKGEETRRRVYAAMQELGEGATVKAVAAHIGMNKVSVQRAMRAVREGWVPEGEG